MSHKIVKGPKPLWVKSLEDEKWVEKSLAGNEITSCATPYDACISARRIFWDKKNGPENLEKPKRKECLWKTNEFTETVLRCLGSKVKQKHCPLLQSVGSLSGNVFPMFEFRSSKSPTITKFKKIGREMFFCLGQKFRHYTKWQAKKKHPVLRTLVFRK